MNTQGLTASQTTDVRFQRGLPLSCPDGSNVQPALKVWDLENFQW